MSGHSQACVEEILSAINDGNITAEEAEKRLQRIIDREESRADQAANAALLQGCYALLFQLHTHGKVDLELHPEKSIEAARERYRSWKAARRRRRFLLPAAAALALLLFTGVSLRSGWFSESDSEDGQQHIIQGHEVRLDFIRQATAGNQDIDLRLKTREELIEHLGYDFGIPERLGTDWELDGIAVNSHFDHFSVDAHYMSPEGKVLLWMQEYYTSLENAWMTFEQDHEGKYVQLPDGTLYVANNAGRKNLMWTDQDAIHLLAGDITEEEGYDLFHFLRSGE